MSETDKDKAPIVILQPEDKGAIAVYRKKRHLFLANFLGGLAWGLGSVLGATLIVATMLFFLNALGGLPIIGGYITDMAEAISRGMNQ